MEVNVRLVLITVNSVILSNFEDSMGNIEKSSNLSTFGMLSAADIECERLITYLLN